jgi:hypothetical protein
MPITIAQPTPLPGQRRDRLRFDLETLAAYYAERGLAGEELNPAELAFSVALARYHLAVPFAPAFTRRKHVAVFGGAGAGKSTAANTLVGADVAEVNAQAGFTRRPTAILHGTPLEIADWPMRLGSLARLDDAADPNQDADFFAVKLLDSEVGESDFLSEFVVWDCPDVTTKDAGRYEFRAIEIAALADVGVYVASDERYNDQLPTHFLQALLDAGKPVVVVLTKVSPLDAESLVGLFQSQVAGRLRRSENIRAVIAVPSPGRSRLSALWTDEFPYGREIRQAVRDACDGDAFRRTASLEAACYLRERQSRLLDPLRKDLGEWRTWLEQVRLAASEAVSRYERDYLSRLDYPEFREAAEKLVGAFAPPPPFDMVWRFFELLRWPVRWIVGNSLAKAPIGGRALSSDAALDRVRRSLMEQLLVASAGRRRRHRFWEQLHASLEFEGRESIDPAFRAIRDRQRAALDQKLREVVDAASETVARRPWLASAMQFGRMAFETVVIVFLLYKLWEANVSWVVMALAAPAAAGALDLMMRWFCRLYVERFRTGIIRQQKEDVREAIQKGYIDQLVLLPQGVGESMQRLAEVAERIPEELSAAAEGVER